MYFGEQNIKIKELIKELDSFDFRDPDYGDKYWECKLRLFQEITKKQGLEYFPEDVKTLHIPAGLISIVVDMEKQNLSLLDELE